MKKKYIEILCALALSLMAGIGGYAVSQMVCCDAVITTDENSYVFQAHAFADGKISREVPPVTDAFAHRMIIMDDQAGWLSRYPPGHPLWLLPGVIIGDPRIMVSLAAVIAVWLAYAIGKQLKVPQLLPPILLIVSPAFIFMHGTLLSHTSGLIASAGMLWVYLAWRRDRRPVFAAMAGLFWGLLFLNRTYTATFLAIPFGIDALCQLARHRDRRTLLGLICFATAAGCTGALALVYNWLAVGDPLQSTYLFYDSSEAPGFGTRHIYGIPIEHSFRNGVSNLTQNLALLDKWLFGFMGSGIAVIILLIVGWSGGLSLLLIGTIASVMLGYLFFWYPGPREVGPGYYFELLPHIIAIVALGLSRISKRLAGRPVLRTAGVLMLVVASLAFAVTFSIKQASGLRKKCEYEGRILKTIAAAPPKSLVILEHIPEPYVGQLTFNPRGLKSDPLIARSLQDSNYILAELFPDRSCFVIRRGSEDTLAPADFTVRLEPAVIHAQDMRTQTGMNESKGPQYDRKIRVARNDRDEPGYLAYGHHQWMGRGQHDITFRISLDGGLDDSPSRLDVCTDLGRTILVQTNLIGTISTIDLTLTIDEDSPLKIEPRAFYGGSGRLVIESISITKQP